MDSREDMLDALEAVILDTHDLDVTDRCYAKAVLRWIERNTPAIKPLAWDDFDGRGAKAKVFYDASYLITKWSTGKFELAVSYPGHQAIFAGPQFYDTLDAAKAAAQADYEARIRSALTTEGEG